VVPIFRVKKKKGEGEILHLSLIPCAGERGKFKGFSETSKALIGGEGERKGGEETKPLTWAYLTVPGKHVTLAREKKKGKKGKRGPPSSCF